MKTFLPKNEFMSSASHVPVDVGSAADSPLPPSKSAAVFSVSDGVGAPISTPSEEAAVVVRTAAASDISDIPELFRVANYLCAEARQFTPDYPGIYQAMMDPTAPRATDDVWSDLAPLFLRDA